MTPREELLQIGVPATNIDHHRSDLYVRVTPLTKKWLESYKYKNNVTTFISNIEPHDLWYDVPFGYIEECIEEDKAERVHLAESIQNRYGRN